MFHDQWLEFFWPQLNITKHTAYMTDKQYDFCISRCFLFFHHCILIITVHIACGCFGYIIFILLLLIPKSEYRNFYHKIRSNQIRFENSDSVLRSINSFFSCLIHFPFDIVHAAHDPDLHFETFNVLSSNLRRK